MRGWQSCMPDWTHNSVDGRTGVTGELFTAPVQALTAGMKGKAECIPWHLLRRWPFIMLSLP